MTTAFTAGPARKIMPYNPITRPRMAGSTAIWISVWALMPVTTIEKPVTKTQTSASS